MKRVITPMPDDLVAQADAEAERQDRSRSWIIRAAVAEYLARRSGAPADEAVISPDQMKVIGKTLARIDKRNARTSTGPGHSFTPQNGNALKCADCGQRKGVHR